MSTVQKTLVQEEQPLRPGAPGERRVVRRRIVSQTPDPPISWYEHIPTWVSISLFLHGLILLLVIAVLGSPGSFGLAEEGEVKRVNAVQAAQAAAVQNQLDELTRRVDAHTVTSLGQPDGGVITRVAGLEGRVAALCARATPPC